MNVNEPEPEPVPDAAKIGHGLGLVHILNFRTVEDHSRLGLRITKNGIPTVITIETLGESAEFTTIEELSASDSIELINASGEFVTLSALLGIVPL